MQKIVINNNNLLKELKRLKNLVPSNPIIPILENFLFEVSDGLLKLTASNLQTYSSISISVESNDTFSIAVPARLLTDTLNNLGSQVITLTFDTDNLEILSDNGRYNIACEDANDFPKPATKKELTSFELDGMSIIDSLSYTLPFTSNDEMKPAMNGVFIQATENGINFVATDSHRLSKVVIDNENNLSNIAIIVPNTALNYLLNIINPNSKEISISYNDTNIFFDFDNVSVISRLIDERFPAYENVIPSNNDKELVIDRKQLLSSLKRVSIFANKTSQQIRFVLKDNNLLVSAEDIDFSNEAKENLPCNYDGDALEIGFNGRFLMENLSNLHSDSIKIELSEPNRAALIYPVDSIDNVLMLVMPVMLNNQY